MGRRAATVLALVALTLSSPILAACQPKAAVAPAAGDEMSMGDAKAKVTLVEYASAGCPFCAHFDTDVFPAFKTKYVDTGKVHYVFREMLVGGGSEIALGAAGFLTARCAGNDKYFAVLDQVFHAQEQIYKSGDIKSGLLPIAKANGLSDKQFEACVNDETAINALNARSEKAGQDGVNSTPTFFINGKKTFEGVPTPQQLDAAIDAAS
ncbi:MAG TPA: DsbA family protein [Caulobacteraceae bacterium]|jgi:protein-disulfide isomerase